MKAFFISLLLLFTSYTLHATGYAKIGGVEYVVDTLEHYSVGPGTVLTKLHFMHEKSPLRVFFYEIDVANPYLKIKAETATGLMTGMEKISATAPRVSKEGANYFAGINGDFYNMTTGQPSHGFMTGGIVGTLPSTNPTFGVNPQNIAYVDVFQFSGVVKVGSATANINRANSDRIENALVLYNYLQGASTKTNIYGTEVLLELTEGNWLPDGTKTKARVKKKESNVGNMTIEENSIVLSGNGTSSAFLESLKVDDIVELNLNLMLASNPSSSHGISEYVGGDRLMLKNGVIAGENWAELHPRTGVGISADKSKIVFSVVNGRQPGVSVGVTTHVFGEIMMMAGASDAMNLDGGGSSGMYLEKYGLVNQVLGGVERSVSNGLFLVSSAPSDNQITSIGFIKPRYELPLKSVLKPVVVGYNKYGHIVSTDLSVKFSCAETLGEVDDDFGFIATGKPQVGKLLAKYGDLSTDAIISVVNEGVISISSDSILIDTKRNYDIDVQVSFNDIVYPILSEALTWKVLDNSVCTIEKGVLRGVSTGQTQIIGTLNDVSDTITVSVQGVVENPYIQTEFENSSDFHYARTSSNLMDTSLAPKDLPEGWMQGSTYSFTYQNGRGGSFVYLNYVPKLYSLPDSLTFTYNTGNTDISKISLMFQSLTDKTEKIIESSVITSGDDHTITVNLNNLYDRTLVAQYPLSLSYICFTLVDSKLKAGAEYNIHLKDVKLFYSDYASGIEEFTSKSGNIFISPNPVKNGEAVLNFASDNSSAFKVDIYNVAGKLCKTTDFDQVEEQQYPLSIQSLAKGLYLVAVSQKGEVNETVKMIVE